jgi:hypothetical protein
VRLVEASREAPWLGGAARGWAVSTLAPAAVFALRGPRTIDTVDGSFHVTPLGPSLPLALLPDLQARAVARAALQRLAKAGVYSSWLRTAESRFLQDAVCLRDELPTTGPTDLSPFVPYLFG